MHDMKIELRKQFKSALVAVAAGALAACSGTETADESVTAEAPAPSASDQARQTPQPGAVDSGRVEEETLGADEFGQPTQDSFEAHAGTDRVFFAFDSAELSPSARNTLQQQAEWIAAQEGVDVLIEGHADERGTREYNLALGDRRATAVKNYLVALGISASRLETISYGKERPAVLGSGENVWRQNRRAVLKVQRAGA